MLKTLRFGLLSASVLALSAGAAFADFELNILHINDFHSRIEAINKFDSTCSEEEAGKNECFGGIARMKTAIEARRSELTGKNVLTLDAGDQFQGSLFYTTYKSGPIAEFMNGIGFDAMAIGNHEFDDGPEELAKFIAALQFPMISGNTLAGLNTPIADKFKPYIIKEFGPEKVAVVSVLATDTDETSSPGDDVLFADEISYLKDAVKEIEQQGVDKIVLLSHVGYPRDQEIAAAVDGIDVIVGGHSHTLLSNTDEKAAGPYPTMVKNPAGQDVPIVTAYAYSKYLGDLTVVFDDDGNVKTATGEPKLLDASVAPDEAFAAKVAELGGPIEDLKKKEIGETADVIDGSRDVCRAAECTMGNLVADAMVDRVKDQGVTIAIQNGGGLRASIDAGTVTMGEVLTVLPFQNTLATFQLKGSDVVAALENGLSQIEEGAGRFPQVSGLKYTFDKSKPAGSRVVSVEVKDGDGFVAIDPDKVYGVATNNYMRGGGDGYKVFATGGTNAYDFGPGLEIVVADYIAANSPYKPYTDGRVSEVASSAPDEAAAPAAATETADTATTATQPQTHTVVRGDNLWNIARDVYGDGMMWSKISEANALRNPDVISIGKELSLPAK
ncbi:5'-nucleotidase C-terminal domain-containing protein [Ciceribacter sp. L1K22]|uniref:5'-nucleotidase C-terminal domain-containing protein n=1 Tax=Ciceribacter sp. L1K22 TaxID=2820275 RepID=UPI001ABE99F8|nr:5'-nucleotidase C-terminal domain-containing protein [Ciceribacter sp. L1K22]MBO3761852.1 5'-nucleotidase C-terminal domain-containing protein [Ciceribacter sp. L1K22]